VPPREWCNITWNLLKNMRKNTRKHKATNKKTINNTIEKEGGFDSSKVAPREKSGTKGGRKTQGKAPGNSRPPRRRLLITL
jgi:hypothetical protein